MVRSQQRGNLARALDRLRDPLNERQFQIFHLNVIKNLSAPEVAKTLGISTARVYLAKPRVSSALKKEIVLRGQHGIGGRLKK
ncbi:MAG: hypothetical protein JWM99_4214 [Verrucomicrobiales bacterium]|nr:hypothetical protein [Verrucomicrobiales bacterium]